MTGTYGVELIAVYSMEGIEANSREEAAEKVKSQVNSGDMEITTAITHSMDGDKETIHYR